VEKKLWKKPRALWPRFPLRQVERRKSPSFITNNTITSLSLSNRVSSHTIDLQWFLIKVDKDGVLYYWPPSTDFHNRTIEAPSARNATPRGIARCAQLALSLHMECFEGLWTGTSATVALFCFALCIAISSLYVILPA